MTAIKGTKAQILVDEFDFSGDTAGIGVTVAMGEQDSTTLQDTAMISEPILPGMTIEQNGYFVGTGAGELEKELWDRLFASGNYVAALFGTDTAACPAYVKDDTFGASMQIQAPTAALITINGAWAKGQGGSRGLRVYTGTLSATGTQTAYDFGSAGTAGGEAYLFIQTITDTATNAVILVESSATEGGAYATEATFTFSAVGASKQTMSGTVNRWLRLNASDLGGATDFTVVLIVCVDGVTQ